jgi:hypothetical protein
MLDAQRAAALGRPAEAAAVMADKASTAAIGEGVEASAG